MMHFTKSGAHMLSGTGADTLLGGEFLSRLLEGNTFCSFREDRLERLQVLSSIAHVSWHVRVAF